LPSGEPFSVPSALPSRRLPLLKMGWLLTWKYASPALVVDGPAMK